MGACLERTAPTRAAGSGLDRCGARGGAGQRFPDFKLGFKAGELPALHDIADGLQAGLERNHPDRGIVLIAAVYLMLGDLLLTMAPDPKDRAAIVIACGEMGSLGAWLGKSRPRTTQGARALLHLSCWILEARERDPGQALAQGPAEKLLALALGALSENPFQPVGAVRAG